MTSSRKEPQNAYLKSVKGTFYIRKYLFSNFLKGSSMTEVDYTQTFLPLRLANLFCEPSSRIYERIYLSLQADHNPLVF